jgi:ABC-type lipoprotein release transport system permease subunit
MPAAWMRVRAELRTRWVAWLAIALVAGVGSGIVVGLMAGARRTESAYPRFVRAEHTSDVLVAGRSSFGLIGSVDLAQVERLPQVASTARGSVSLFFAGMLSDGRDIGPADVFPVAAADTRLGDAVEKWKMLAGRRADPTKAMEATASFVLAQRLHLHVGDTMRLRFVLANSFPRVAVLLLSQFGARLAAAPGSDATSIQALADGPDVTVQIVGIEASPAEFPPLGADLSPALHLTPAWYRLYSGEVVSSPLDYVRLHHAGDLPAFARALERLAPGQPVGFIASRPNQSAKVQRTIDLEATALRLLAALTFVALVFIVGQTLLRQAYVERRDDTALRALGMERLQLVLVGIARAVVIAVAAGVVAVVVAVVASPLMPIGLARTAELHHGIDVDVLVIGLGFAATVFGIAAIGALAAWRATQPVRSSSAPGRTPWIARVLAGRPLRPSTSVGIRFALDPGRGPTAVPVWTGILGVALAVVMLTGAWTFRTSLRHLVATPALYGWNWDAKTGAPALPDIGGVLVPAFEQNPGIRAFSAGTVVQVQIGGGRVDALALDQERGTVGPTLLEGRRPRTPGEVALGTNTLDGLGRSVGDDVTVVLGSRSERMHVVGRAVFPEYGDAGELGTGALVTYKGIQRLLPDAHRNVFLLRFAPSANRGAEFARLRAALAPVPTRTSGRPPDLEDLANLASLPAVLTVVLAALGAATLVHTLVTSVRRRRRDLAVLKTLGFRRRQVSFVVAWQTTTLVVLALAIGVPLGTAVGRWAWTAYSDHLGAVASSQVPPLPILLAVPIALLFANAVAAVPAWLAARTRPAAIFHTE